MEGTRRLLIGIPLSAALVGIALFLWHNSEDRSASAQREGRQRIRSTPVISTTSTAPIRNTTNPPSSRPSLTGSLRIFIHAAGRGIDRATVRVHPQARPSDGRVFETGPDGIRLMEGMPLGGYMITARAPGFISTGMTASIQANRTTKISIGLKRGGTVFGAVRSDGGMPLAEVKINLIDNKNRRFIHPALSTVTDAEGRYRIEGIPPREFGVHFRHPEYKVFIQFNRAIHTPDDKLEVNASLHFGTTVSGRVVDAEGRAIERAAVMAVNEETALMNTDKDGRFELSGLGDLPMSISAQKPGYGTEYRQEIAPNSKGIVIKLYNAGQIRVRIQAEPFPPLFTVLLVQFVERFKKEITVQTQTFEQDDGSFLVRNVAPGTYWIDVKAPGYKVLDRPQIVVQSDVTAENLVIRLRKTK